MKKLEVAILARLDGETETLGQRSIRVPIEVPEDMPHAEAIAHGIAKAGDPESWAQY